MLDKINCCNLALIAFLGNIVQLVFFFNYSLKLKDKSIRLERSKDKQENRIKELEKKNGKELKRIEEIDKSKQEQINQLKEEIQELKKKYGRNQ